MTNFTPTDDADEVVADLTELVGAGAVSADPAVLAAHSSDWSARAFIDRRTGSSGAPPLCVATPADVSEVAAVLAWASRTGTAVVPFGAGSGVCEGVRGSGAVVLSLAHLNDIDAVDDASMTITVGAGVRGADVAAVLAASGLTLGHEPQSIGISTVGGWLATRACGQLSARYGGIEDIVAGVEAVLPDGSVLDLKPSPRRATGPDLAALLIGSEGTLGVITRATLRVWERDRERADQALFFEHMSDGVAACRAIARSDTRPSVVRLYDADDAALFLGGEGERHPAGPLLLLSFEGTDAGERSDRAAGLCDGTPGPARLVDRWWTHRNDAVEAFRTVMTEDGLLGPSGVVDTMEVSAPWGRLRELYHGMKKALGAEADLTACHLSHIYPDGACLYFTMASAAANDEVAREVHARWWEVGMRACLDNGGAISHHHGIGRLKAPWLQEELGGWWGLLATIKRAVDPAGIMNPGVLGL